MSFRRILLCSWGCAGAGLFSKQLRCSEGSCKNVLTGLITLTNGEAFEYESFNVKDVRTPEASTSATTDDIPVVLKIEKSRLMLAYGLEWQKDVAGGVSEQVYDYSWANAGGSHAFEGSDFDSDRCERERAAVGDDVTDAFLTDAASRAELEPLLKGGRVCGCRDTGWGGSSYTDVHRSDLNCNAWSAVFRPGSTIWASRHCPSLLGPMFSVYSIREWKWEYHVKVTMSWTADAVLHSRSYVLNWTNPEVRDKELDFSFKILFSLPQFGQQPPDLHATHYLLVPKAQPSEFARTQSLPSSNITKDLLLSKMTPTEIQLNTLAGDSLLLPKDRVDLTGRGCEKVGVSLFTWAREENTDAGNASWVAQQDFCESPAGTCIHLQPNDLLAQDRQSKERQYILSAHRLDGWGQSAPYLLSDRSMFSPSRSDFPTPAPTSTEFFTDEVDGQTTQPAADIPLSASIVAWPTGQSHSTQLEVSLNSLDIAWLPKPGRGEIEDVLVHNTDSLVSMLVLVRNKESEQSKFTVAVPRCDMTSEDFSAEEDQGKVYPSPKMLSAAPVSKSIRGDKTSGIIVPLDRLTGSSRATYDCYMELLDSQGGILQNHTAVVEFASRKLSVTTVEKPLQSDTPVQNFRINASDLHAQPYNSDNHLRAVSSGSDWFGQCQCELWNMWCFATHIFDCTRAIRSLVLIVAVLVGSCVLVVVFLPCLTRTCASCVRYTSKQMRKSRHEMRARKNSQMPLSLPRKEITAVESSDMTATPMSVSTPAPRHTPRHGNVNRAIQSRCSRRINDSVHCSTARACHLREGTRSAHVDKYDRCTSRRSIQRFSPESSFAPMAERPRKSQPSQECSSRPTTASLRTTQGVVIPEIGRRTDFIRVMMHTNEHNNSCFGDDDASSVSSGDREYRDRRRNHS